MLTRHEVLRLQFFSSTRSETHAEMRKTFVPGTRHAHLLGAVFCRQFRDGMQISSRELRLVKYWRRLGLGLRINAALEPYLVEARLSPVGKQADTVSACFNSVKVMSKST